MPRKKKPKQITLPWAKEFRKLVDEHTPDKVISYFLVYCDLEEQKVAQGLEELPIDAELLERWNNESKD